MAAHAQLLVYRFGASANFEGQLLAALDRIETGGALRILDVLLVASDLEDGEIFAIELSRTGAGGFAGPLVGFRLDIAERRRITRRARAGASADLITTLSETLGPGEAVAAVLVGHDWARALDDAVARIGGTGLASTFVDAATLTDLTRELVEVAASAHPG
jgi:hypothetical protein